MKVNPAGIVGAGLSSERLFDSSKHTQGYQVVILGCLENKKF